MIYCSKPEILNEVAALEIFQDGRVYYKIRCPSILFLALDKSSKYKVKDTFEEF